MPTTSLASQTPSHSLASETSQQLGWVYIKGKRGDIIVIHASGTPTTLVRAHHNDTGVNIPVAAVSSHIPKAL